VFNENIETDLIIGKMGIDEFIRVSEKVVFINDNLLASQTLTFYVRRGEGTVDQSPGAEKEDSAPSMTSVTFFVGGVKVKTCLVKGGIFIACSMPFSKQRKKSPDLIFMMPNSRVSCENN